MTDDEIRAALRRVRIGPPGEWPFRYGPAVVVISALVVPPVSTFEGLLLAVAVVALVWSAMLQWVALHGDRTATRDALCRTFRELAEERLKWDRSMYPAMAIALAVGAALLGVVLCGPLLSGRGLDTRPMDVAISLSGLLMAASLVYYHLVRAPDLRRVLDALSAPSPAAAPGGPVGDPPPAA